MGVLGEFLSLFFGRGGGGAPQRAVPVCPSCRGELQRVQGGKGCHRCPICKGLWMTEEFLGLALAAQEEQIQALLAGGSGEHTFSRSERRDCPGCGQSMDNYPFGYQSGIWVDGCPHNHGLWFDAGELALVRAYQQRCQQPLTAQEKAAMAMALMDGASQSRRNILDALPQPPDHYENAYRDSSYDPNDPF